MSKVKMLAGLLMVCTITLIIMQACASMATDILAKYPAVKTGDTSAAPVTHFPSLWTTKFWMGTGHKPVAQEPTRQGTQDTSQNGQDWSPLNGTSVALPGNNTTTQALRSQINKTLTGYNITYYSIAGQPMNYTVTADDIKSIEKTDYNGGDAWKVRIVEGLSWDVILSADGTRVLDTRQLFQT